MQGTVQKRIQSVLFARSAASNLFRIDNKLFYQKKICTFTFAVYCHDLRYTEKKGKGKGRFQKEEKKLGENS